MTDELYRIGTVSRMTGLSPERLRAWERRYGLAPAERSGKTRLYDQEQVARLTLVKSLLDQGHPVGQVIALSTDALERRLQQGRPTHVTSVDVRSPGARLVKVAVAGAPLVRASRDADERSVEVVAEWAGVGDLVRDAVPNQFDCLIAYMSSLDELEVDRVLTFCGDTRVVFVFRYATVADLDACREAGCRLVRWPTDWRALEQAVQDTLAHAPPTASRRFSDEELLHISVIADRASCECARHLAALVGELNDYLVHAVRCDADDRHDEMTACVEAARIQVEAALHLQVEEHGLLASVD